MLLGQASIKPVHKQDMPVTRCQANILFRITIILAVLESSSRLLEWLTASRGLEEARIRAGIVCN